MERLQNIQSNTYNQQTFLQSLRKEGLKIYERNGKVTGLYAPESNRKYRFKTLGIDISKERERKYEVQKEANKSRPQSMLERMNAMTEERQNELENEQDQDMER